MTSIQPPVPSPAMGNGLLKLKVLTRIIESGLVAVIRAESADEASRIQAGCVAVSVGGNLTSGAKTGDFRSIAERARRFSEEIRRARA